MVTSAMPVTLPPAQTRHEVRRHGSFDSFPSEVRKVGAACVDANVVSAMSSSVRSADPRIAEALRLPVMERHTILNDLRLRRRSRKVGTAVHDRFKISLPWDDHIGLA